MSIRRREVAGHVYLAIRRVPSFLNISKLLPPVRQHLKCDITTSTKDDDNLVVLVRVQVYHRSTAQR
jgi:hypothetical protein